ncbi:MAG: HindIII family type II restriction endonuclease [Firmicutes bacterium]|nr:HindIII family type II restriction endonuclease [Bacillota bacterium]
MFERLVSMIFELAPKDFLRSVEVIAGYIDNAVDFIGILEQIGTIPESIEHDSTEEKLFAKASDAVLSRAFREIGLKSTILPERADAADVLAESNIFGYTMVADAKVFRMSRTAKNQKDFKVSALSGWRKDADYAVLCSPYFHYPRSQSQIYAQAIEYNVCLLSWENLIFMLKNGVKENIDLNLSFMWNYGERISHSIVFADKKRCFLSDFKNVFLSTIGFSEKEYAASVNIHKSIILQRSLTERISLENMRSTILCYSRDQAISELIKAKKIDEKIKQIDQFVRGLRLD